MLSHCTLAWVTDLSRTWPLHLLGVGRPGTWHMVSIVQHHSSGAWEESNISVCTAFPCVFVIPIVDKFACKSKWNLYVTHAILSVSNTNTLTHSFRKPSKCQQMAWSCLKLQGKSLQSLAYVDATGLHVQLLPTYSLHMAATALEVHIILSMQGLPHQRDFFSQCHSQGEISGSQRPAPSVSCFNSTGQATEKSAIRHCQLSFPQMVLVKFCV